MVRIFSCYHNSSEWEFKLIDPEEVARQWLGLLKEQTEDELRQGV